jgi:hypothetical protein
MLGLPQNESWEIYWEIGWLGGWEIGLEIVREGGLHHEGQMTHWGMRLG